MNLRYTRHDEENPTLTTRCLALVSMSYFRDVPFGSPFLATVLEIVPHQASPDLVTCVG